MDDIFFAFASFLMYPSVAFGILIGAGIGALFSYFYLGSIDFIVIAVAAAVCGVLNGALFRYLDKK